MGIKLTKHFNKEEFACKCKQCSGENKIKLSFVEQLEEARVISKIAYKLTSGYRCKLHPETIKNPTSSHPKGVAADIYIHNSIIRLKTLRGLILAGFKRIGIGKDFIHVDSDKSKPSVIWTYYKKH